MIPRDHATTRGGGPPATVHRQPRGEATLRGGRRSVGGPGHHKFGQPGAPTRPAEARLAHSDVCEGVVDVDLDGPIAGRVCRRKQGDQQRWSPPVPTAVTADIHGPDHQSVTVAAVTVGGDSGDDVPRPHRARGAAGQHRLAVSTHAVLSGVREALMRQLEGWCLLEPQQHRDGFLIAHSTAQSECFKKAAPEGSSCRSTSG
ncbi:UNVERIFIED_CONTAM: hypothetical protein BEN50_16625 [Euhalothece sp. KZN 001]